MKETIQILKRMIALRDEAGRNSLMMAFRFPYSSPPDRDPFGDLFAFYCRGIETMCAVIKKRDLKNLSWLELNVLVKATNPKDKLRRWVFERQKEFPGVTTEAQHRREVKKFN